MSLGVFGGQLLLEKNSSDYEWSLLFFPLSLSGCICPNQSAQEIKKLPHLKTREATGKVMVTTICRALFSFDLVCFKTNQLFGWELSGIHDCGNCASSEYRKILWDPTNTIFSIPLGREVYWLDGCSKKGNLSLLHNCFPVPLERSGTKGCTNPHAPRVVVLFLFWFLLRPPVWSRWLHGFRIKRHPTWVPVVALFTSPQLTHFPLTF